MPAPTPAQLQMSEPLRVAQAKTVLIFEVFLKVGQTPPVHSASGLPRQDSCMGCSALFDALATRDMIAGETAPYFAVAADEAGLPLEEAVRAFISGYREPRTPAETLRAKTGARALLAEMKARGYVAGLPLADNGLPESPAFWSAYASLYSVLQAARQSEPLPLYRAPKPTSLPQPLAAELVAA